MNDLWLLFKGALEQSGPVAIVIGTLLIVMVYALFRAIPAIFYHLRQQSEMHRAESEQITKMHLDSLLRATNDHKQAVQSLVEGFERTLTIVKEVIKSPSKE